MPIGKTVFNLSTIGRRTCHLGVTVRGKKSVREAGKLLASGMVLSRHSNPDHRKILKEHLKIDREKQTVDTCGCIPKELDTSTFLEKLSDSKFLGKGLREGDRFHFPDHGQSLAFRYLGNDAFRIVDWGNQALNLAELLGWEMDIGRVEFLLQASTEDPMLFERGSRIMGIPWDLIRFFRQQQIEEPCDLPASINQFTHTFTSKWGKDELPVFVDVKRDDAFNYHINNLGSTLGEHVSSVSYEPMEMGARRDVSYTVSLRPLGAYETWGWNTQDVLDQVKDTLKQSHRTLVAA